MARVPDLSRLSNATGVREAPGAFEVLRKDRADDQLMREALDLAKVLTAGLRYVGLGAVELGQEAYAAWQRHSSSDVLTRKGLGNLERSRQWRAIMNDVLSSMERVKPLSGAQRAKFWKNAKEYYERETKQEMWMYL